MNDMLMGTYTLGSIKTISHMDREFLTGNELKKFMMGNGIKARRMGMEFGKMLREIATLDNGKIAKQKGTVCTHGQMEIDTKESGTTVSNTEEGVISSLMVMFIKENIYMESHMEKALILG